MENAPSAVDETEPTPTQAARDLGNLARELLHVAHSGMARGIAPTDLLPGLLTYAHGMRGSLDLLTAHSLALDVWRHVRGAFRHGAGN